jgi:hypothetical protein
MKQSIFVSSSKPSTREVPLTASARATTSPGAVDHPTSFPTVERHVTPAGPTGD